MAEGDGTIFFYLKNGVLVLVLRRMSRGVFPWNPEAHGLAVDPHQPRVPAAVHLSHQPGLQPDASRSDGHSAPAETQSGRTGERPQTAKATSEGSAQVAVKSSKLKPTE